MIDLTAKYNSSILKGLLKAFLPDDLEFLHQAKDVRLSQQFKRIKKAHVLAEVPSLDLSIIELHHSSTSDPRVEISKEAFRIMAESFKHRAIVASKNMNSDQWRLSLMTIDLDINTKGQAKQIYSNPRRYSYLLGPDSKVVTPGKYLLGIGKAKSFEDLQKRFALEVVNNEFYKEIAKLYDELVGTDKVERTLKYPGKEEESYEFAVRLIGRIIFCWFLREKKSESNVPLIPKDLLSLEAANTKNYYHQVLAPLFFEVLNKAPEKRTPRFKINGFQKIPYLNGGLFKDDDIDHYGFDKELEDSVAGLVDVPDAWLLKLFDLLERYNFTVDENTSYDIDLSIDPEMLGRVFENLLARINPETGETVRKSTGSFYTPREIVDYMVDVSLIEYLSTKTSVKKEKLEALVSYDLSDDADYELPNEEKHEVLGALSTLTVLDPACGSGAFPIGMLQKIVFIISNLDPEAKWWLSKQLENASPELKREFENKGVDYIRKLGIIRQTIFGVDIQPIATEISRLRCFLTLIVDEAIDDNAWNRGIRPLPNLDFKFVTANTLIPLPIQRDKNSLPTKNQEVLFEDKSHIEELRELRNEYFTSTNHKRLELQVKFSELQKKMVLKNIDEFSGQASELYNALSRWDPFGHKASSWFDPEWMFGISNIDIVIANPPYLSEKGQKDLFRELAKSSLGEKYYQGKMDIFYFFFHLGLDLLRHGGTLAFISTNYYLTATNANKLREDFKKRATILSIINLNEVKIFESALGQHNAITFLKKGHFNIEGKTAATNRIGYLRADDALNKILSWQDKETDYYVKNQEELFNHRGFLDLRNDPRSNLLEKIASESDRLDKYFQISEGLQTGSNKVFVFDGKPSFFQELNEREKALFKDFYKNSDIKKYFTGHRPNKWVLYVDSTFIPSKCPRIMKYLIENEAELKNRAQIIRSNQPWYTLLWPREKGMFEGGKIVSPYRAKGNVFSFSNKSWYSATDTYFIYKPKKNLLFALGTLNSEFALSWFKTKGALKGNMLELKGDNIASFPIPKNIDRRLEDHICEICSKIIDVIKVPSSSISKLEGDLNSLVFQLYGLTSDEIKTIKSAT